MSLKILSTDPNFIPEEMYENKHFVIFFIYVDNVYLHNTYFVIYIKVVYNNFTIKNGFRNYSNR